MVFDVSPYSSRVRDIPGAQRELAMGLKVDIEPIHNMSIHFFPQLQFLFRSQLVEMVFNQHIGLTEGSQDLPRFPILPYHFPDPSIRECGLQWL